MAVLKVYDRDAASWIEIPVGTLLAFSAVEPPDSNTITADVSGDTLILAAGGGMTITGDGVDTVTFTSKVGKHEVVLLAAGTPVDF